MCYNPKMNNEGLISISELATIAQQERIKKTQKPFGLIDRFWGHHVESATVSNNVLVDTLIISGNAKLRQEWHFRDDSLEKVQILRWFKTWKGWENISYSRIERDELGKLQLVFASKGNSKKQKDWKKEFSTVYRRLNNQN